MSHPPILTDRCVVEHMCASCNKVPGCTFCHAGQVSFELQGCFNTSSHPRFCPDAIANPRRCPLKSATPEQHDVADARACKRLCLQTTGTKSTSMHCRLPLIPWLLLTSYTRMDVLLKAVIADGWVQDKHIYDEAYKAFIAKRTNRPDWANPRLASFHGLVTSVQQRGFDWPHSPIRVRPDFTILDGSHRVAVALALNHSHIVIAHPGCSMPTDETQDTPRPQTLAHLKHMIRNKTLLARVRDISVERLGWGSKGQAAPPSTAMERLQPLRPGMVAPRFVAIVWGCARHLWPEIIGHVHGVLAGGFGGMITSACVVAHGPDEGLASFVEAVYAVDDVSNRSLAIKLSRLETCARESLLLNLTVSQPQWRQKANGKPISRAMEALKLRVRGQYKQRVPNYIHDVILHAADNEVTHTRHIDSLLASLASPKACTTDVLGFDPVRTKVTRPYSRKSQRATNAAHSAVWPPRPEKAPLDSRPSSNGISSTRPSSSSSCMLIEQTSFAPCTLGVSFGCDEASQTMWVRNCRGRFRCLHRQQPTSCGYPPGRPFYNCSCSRVEVAEGLTRRGRSEGAKTLRSRGVQPAVGAFLESICNLGLVHMVIKLDGQPARFPAVVHFGGDVDILTTDDHFLNLQSAVTRFFNDRLAMLGANATSRALSEKHNSEWRFRMEQRGRLIYQVHLKKAADAEAAAMLDRRRLVERSPFLWAPAPADAARLRERDCAEKRRLGRMVPACTAT